MGNIPSKKINRTGKVAKVMVGGFPAIGRESKTNNYAIGRKGK